MVNETTDPRTLVYFNMKLLAKRVDVLAKTERNSHPVLVEELEQTEYKDRPQIIARHDALNSIEGEELADIDNALQRIEDGVYGLCPDCGENILLDRLEAIPTAKRCVGCQSKKKKRNK